MAVRIGAAIEGMGIPDRHALFFGNRHVPLILSHLVGLFMGLLSNVVAGYLVPAFEQRAGLAVSLYLLCAIIGLWFLLNQERDRTTRPLLARIQPARMRQLRMVLENVQDFDTVGGRQLWLQNALSKRQDEKLYNKIKLEGSKDQFINNLLNTLLQEQWLTSGKPYLTTLLQLIRADSGLEIQHEIDDLLPVINELSPRPIPSQPNFRSLWYQIQHYKIDTVWIYLAVIPLLLLLVLRGGPLISDAWAQMAPTCPPDRTCILIADFEPIESGSAIDLTDLVEESLRKVLTSHWEKGTSWVGNKRITIKRVAAIRDATAAHQLIQEKRALLIIWGDEKTSLNTATIHFELVDLMGIGDSAEVRTFRLEPQVYNPIDQNIHCPNCLFIETAEDVRQQSYTIAHTALGLLHYVQSFPEKARSEFEAALEWARKPVNSDQVIKEPNPCDTDDCKSSYALLYYYLGRSLQQTGHYEQAIDHLEEASALNPDDPAAVAGLGLVYREWLADLDKASDYLEDAIGLVDILAIYPEVEEIADLHYMRGVIYEVMEQYDAAQAAYKRSMDFYQKQHSSGEIGVYNAMVAQGRVLRRMKKPDKDETAREILEDAKDLFKAVPWAYLELAHLPQLSTDDAKGWLNEAVKAAPLSADVYITSAELYIKWGYYPQAEAAYQRALSLRPHSGLLHSLLGTYYRDHTQDRSEAITNYEIALSLRLCDPWQHERLAETAGNHGRYEVAVRHYRIANRLTHEDTPREHLNRLGKGLQLGLSSMDGEADGKTDEELLSACGDLSK